MGLKLKKELRPAVFLDRDGTINVEKRYLYNIEDFEYMDGVVEGLQQLQAWGFLLVIITNQSGIARGYYSEDDFQRLTNWMISDLEAKRIHIDGIYYCPHHPEGMIERYKKDCNCRKPKTELFYRAARDLGIDLHRSIAIGDKLRDLTICQEVGTMGILLSEGDCEMIGCISCRNWDDIIRSIESMEKRLQKKAP